MLDLRKALSVGLAHSAYRAYGLDVFRRYAWLKETESWSPEERQKWKLERLNSILHFTWENVPFYRDFWSAHGVRQATLRHIDELKAYPILRKETFRNHWEKIRPREVNRIPHICKNSGGTTGKPVHYLLDREQWAVMQAFQLWGWARAGYSFGDPVGVLTGGSLMPKQITLFERTRTFIERRLFLFGVQMDAELARQYRQQLEAFGAEYLYGYPSILYMFAKHLMEQHLRLPGIKAVVVTAEMLQPHYRSGIESAFNCKVFDDYGCNDGGLESFECKFHRGFHYNDLQSILELENRDGNSSGTLLITNLWNRSTPFIRYENGDKISLRESECECGAKFPVIRNVEGRTADILKFENGQCFVCPPHLFGDMHIDGWQVVQTGPLKVEVRLAQKGRIDRNYILRVEKVMRHHLDASIKVEVKHVDKLAVTQGGKLKPVWSEVRTEEPALSALR